MRLKIKTEDTIIFTRRVIVLDAESKEEAKEIVKKRHPNDRVLAIEEVENDN